jgi:hypothetical protein
LDHSTNHIGAETSVNLARHFYEKTVQFSAMFIDVTGRQIHGSGVQDSKLTDAVTMVNEQQVSFPRFASQSYATGTANASRV